MDLIFKFSAHPMALFFNSNTSLVNVALWLFDPEKAFSLSFRQSVPANSLGDFEKCFQSKSQDPSAPMASSSILI
ncbi:hypothetical protein [Paraglaciecola polaris]|nr:hypothetical protein [Paraglaciecola polaris]